MDWMRIVDESDALIGAAYELEKLVTHKDREGFDTERLF